MKTEKSWAQQASERRSVVLNVEADYNDYGYEVYNCYLFMYVFHGHLEKNYLTAVQFNRF